MKGPDAHFRHPKIVVIVNDKDNTYSMVKEVC